MSATRIDLLIEQGATFQHVFTKTNADGSAFDLTGATARMQVRSEIGSASTLLDLTTENGGLVNGTTAGTITTFISDANTSAITWLNGVYDIEIVHTDTTVERFAYGKVEVSREITR